MTDSATRAQPTAADLRTIGKADRLTQDELEKIDAYWRACAGRARQTAAPRPLGHESRLELYLRTPQPPDQQIRPRRHLHRRSRPWRAGRARTGLSRRHLLGGVSEQSRGRRGAEPVLQ